MKYEKDVDGRWHYIEYQQQGSSCGPACVKIVAKMVNNQDLGEDYCRAQIAASEGFPGASLGTTGVLVESGRDFYSFGTMNVGEGLRSLRPPIAYDQYKSIDPSMHLLATSVKRPAITEVCWAGGGRHWVVVAGPLSGDRYLVIDPWYGIQYVRVLSSQFQVYEPLQKATGSVLNSARWGFNVILTR